MQSCCDRPDSTHVPHHLGPSIVIENVRFRGPGTVNHGTVAAAELVGQPINPAVLAEARRGASRRIRPPRVRVVAATRIRGGGAR